MSSNTASSTMIPFERYDEEFLSLTEQVTSKLRALDPRTTSISPSSSSSSADADVRMAHALLLQADDLLKQMGLEARGVEDASVKRDLLGKVCSLLLLFMCALSGSQVTERKWITEGRGGVEERNHLRLLVIYPPGRNWGGGGDFYSRRTDLFPLVIVFHYSQPIQIPNKNKIFRAGTSVQGQTRQSPR